MSLWCLNTIVKCEDHPVSKGMDKSCEVQCRQFLSSLSFLWAFEGKKEKCTLLRVHAYVCACVYVCMHCAWRGVRARVLPEKGTLMRGVRLHGHSNFRKRSSCSELVHYSTAAILSSGREGLISYCSTEKKNASTLAGAAALDDFCILWVLVPKANSPL